MRHWLPVVVVLMLLCGPALARAEHDGNELGGECTVALRSIEDPSFHATQPDALRSGMCFGLVRGVWNTLTMWDYVDSKHNEPTFHGCIPDGVTLVEAIKVVMKFLNDNPTQLHQKDTLLIHLALVAGYPCSASPGAAK
jgi:hypothetical protein